jgi:hypothetical protein
MFIALCRRYGTAIRGCAGQNVMVAPETFLNKVLRPEFQEINAALNDYLAQVTDKVIREAVHKDSSDADEVPKPAKIRR